MLKKIVHLAVAIGLVSGVALFALATPVEAGQTNQERCDDGDMAACLKVGADSATGDSAEGDLMGTIQTIVNVILMILGAVAVIMIIIGGLRYVTSNGDSGNLKSAKDTILYAVIGLIVAILAYAIVNFVVTAFI